MSESRRVQYLAALAVSLTTMTTSISYYWSAPILPKFYNNEIVPNITSSEISWVVAILPLGMVPGSLIASRIADKFGRRTTLLASAFPYIIGTLIILWATKAWMLYIARILWGCGTGMVTTISSAYVSEIADKEIRGSLTAGTRFMFCLGELLVMTVGSLVSYEMLSSVVIVLPVGFFIACWLMPESPYYLLKEGKVEAAKKVLMRLNGSKDEKVIEERLSDMRSDVRKEMAKSGSFKELITGKQYRKAIIIVTGLRITQLLSGTVPIQQYLARIIQQSNSGMQISTGLITFGSIRLAVSLILPLIIDKVGRRSLLLSSFFLASILLAIVGAYFFKIQVIDIENVAADPYGYIVFVGVVLSMIVGHIGYNSLMFVIPAELFPLNVKSIAMTSLSILTAFLTLTSVRGYQIMEDNIGFYGVFWVYASMAMCGAVFTYFIVPETKGKSLREIQIELQGNMYDEADVKLNTVEVANDNAEHGKELENITSNKENR